MPDISFDENYMSYYDDDGNLVTPDDPRDVEGYDEWHNFQERGKWKNERWRSDNPEAIFKRETLPIIIGGVAIWYFFK